MRQFSDARATADSILSDMALGCPGERIGRTCIERAYLIGGEPLVVNLKIRSKQQRCGKLFHSVADRLRRGVKAPVVDRPAHATTSRKEVCRRVVIKAHHRGD